jgi:hypothetical protein
MAKVKNIKKIFFGIPCKITKQPYLFPICSLDELLIPICAWSQLQYDFLAWRKPIGGPQKKKKTFFLAFEYVLPVHRNPSE